MKKGTYLKENKSPEGYKVTNRLTIEERQQRKAKCLRKQRRRKQLLAATGVLFAVLIFILLVLVVIHRNSPLKGRWYMDDVTAYEFYDGSKGAMVLPSAEYEFTYTITDDTLNIDFDYEGAKDAQYTFVIDGDTLTLEGGNETTQGTYVLKKSE